MPLSCAANSASTTCWAMATASSTGKAPPARRVASVAPEPGVARAVHLAHPAHADEREDLVAAGARTWRQAHAQPDYMRVVQLPN